MKAPTKAQESGKDKVKKICDILRKETLEPAQAEADAIVEEARREAERLIKEAQQTIQEMKGNATREIEGQKNIFQSSLVQASKQAIEALKQQIVEKLFNQELGHQIRNATQNPNVIAAMITGLVRALEKEGIDTPLSAYVSANVSADEVNALLGKEILEKLKEKSVLLSNIGGGVSLKVHRDNITLDMTDAALKELLAGFVRKDFREMIFQAT